MGMNKTYVFFKLNDNSEIIFNVSNHDHENDVHNIYL